MMTMIEKLAYAYYCARYRAIQVGFACRYFHEGVSWGDAMSLGAYDTDQLWERELQEAAKAERRDQAKETSR